MSHGVPVSPKSLFYLGLLLAVTAAAGAQGVDLRQVAGSGGASDGFLKPDQAFVLTAESESPDRVTLRWQIAKDYYLYRDKIAVSTVTPDAELGTPVMPSGKVKHDEYFGEQVVYYDELVVNVPISRRSELARTALGGHLSGLRRGGAMLPTDTQADHRGAPAAWRPPQPPMQRRRLATAARRPAVPSRTRSRIASGAAACSACWRSFSLPGSGSHSRPAYCRWCPSSPASSSAPAVSDPFRAAERSRSRSPTCWAWPSPIPWRARSLHSPVNRRRHSSRSPG